eukprot:COSAG01_NODE_862_length_13058_cov_6.823366_15_plen_313_part_00
MDSELKRKQRSGTYLSVAIPVVVHQRRGDTRGETWPPLWLTATAHTSESSPSQRAGCRHQKLFEQILRARGAEPMKPTRSRSKTINDVHQPSPKSHRPREYSVGNSRGVLKTVAIGAFQNNLKDQNSLHGSVFSVDDDDTNIRETFWQRCRRCCKQKRAAEQMPWGIVHPTGLFHACWDIVQVLALAYVAISVPMQIGFDLTVVVGTGHFWFDVFVDLYFIIDIGVNFRTAFVTKIGNLETRPRQIARHYMQDFFIVDLLSCIPVSYVLLIVDGGDTGRAHGSKSLRSFKLLRLIRLTKLLRLAKLKKVVQV